MISLSDGGREDQRLLSDIYIMNMKTDVVVIYLESQHGVCSQSEMLTLK